MKKRKTETTRILIRDNDGIIRRVCNISSMYDNERLYEYKLTFDKAPRDYYLMQDVIFDSTEGILKEPNSKKIMGKNIEICYHSNGKLSYKIIQTDSNHFYTKSKPFNKIKNYILFFRLSTSSIKILKVFTKKLNPTDHVLEIPKLLDRSFTIDFYLMKKNIRFKTPSKFNYNYQFTYQDEEELFYLLLHFYAIKKLDNAIIFTIIPNNLRNNIKNKFYFYIYKFFNKLHDIK